MSSDNNNNNNNEIPRTERKNKREDEDQLPSGLAMNENDNNDGADDLEMGEIITMSLDASHENEKNKNHSSSSLKDDKFHDEIQQNFDESGSDSENDDTENRFLLPPAEPMSRSCSFHDCLDDEFDCDLETRTTLATNTPTTTTTMHTGASTDNIVDTTPSTLPVSDRDFGLVLALLMRTTQIENTGTDENQDEDNQEDHFSDHDTQHEGDDKTECSCDTETRENTEQTKLSTDTFSFLVVAPIRSCPFFTGMFVVFLKVAVFALIVASVVDLDNETNPLGIPTSVTGPVIVGQFLAMLITVATQDDLISSLHLINGVSYLGHLMRAHPQASFFKWVLATTLLFSTGALGLVVTFILVVTSSDLVELMLNFTAVEFVSLLDNVAFLLAHQGLLGLENKKVAIAIEDKPYRVPKRTNFVPYKMIAVMAVSFIALLGGWGYVYYLQLIGAYTPITLIVQFDDEVLLELGAYSGTYELHNNALAFGFSRIRYENIDGDGLFAYCKEWQAWTFTLDKSPQANPCENVLVRSSHSVSFDITETASEQWFVTPNVEESRFFPMNAFHMALGCEEDSDCGGHGRGICNDESRCICNEGFYGANCDFIKATTCPTLELDESSLFAQGRRQFSRIYYVVMDRDLSENDSTEPPQPVELFHRHVFVSDFQENTDTNIILFTGLRWILTEISSDLNITDMASLREFLKIPQAKIALSLLRKESNLASEPLRRNSPEDVVPVPLGLEWFPIRRVGNETRFSPSVDLILFCATCNNQNNPCDFGNQCLENGQCSCTNGASGTLCQNAPLGDAICHNDFFNVGSFGFDGGDCCEMTCISKDDKFCGVIEREDIGNVYVGFPQCADAVGICSASQRKNQGSCYLPKSNPVVSLSRFTEAVVALSANGRTIVIAEPRLDLVRVFDQIDANWLQRGTTLEGNRLSGFGQNIAIARSPSEIIGRLNSHLPLVLAISFRPGRVRVLRWANTKGEWLQIGPDVKICIQSECDIIDIDVAVDGDEIILVASSTVQGGTATAFSIFSDGTLTSPWTQIMETKGTKVSISEASRGILAVAQDEEQMIRRYDLRAARLDVSRRLQNEVSPFLISSHDLSAFGNTTLIKSIKIEGDGEKITAFLENTVQTFSLLRFNSKARQPRPHRGTILEFDDAENPPIIGFSHDGSLVVATRDFVSEGRIVRSLQFDENTLNWKQLGSDIQVSSRGEEFAISADASTLVVGGDSPTEFFRLDSGCNGTSFRFSFVLDDLPHDISWSIQSHYFLGGIELETQTHSHVCKNCYTDDLFRTMGFKSGCLPANECMRFHFEKKGGFDEDSGFVFWVNGTENGTLSSETDDAFDLVLHERNACSLEVLKCEEGYSQLTLILELDGHPDEISWYIRDSAKNTILSQDNYTQPGRHIRQHCVPSSECLSITFIDSAGDGFLQSSGSGQYSIHLDGRTIIRRNGDFGNGEQFIFGDCQRRIVRPVEAELAFFYDPFLGKPNETTWTVRDSEGRKISNGGPYLDLESLRLHHGEISPLVKLPCNVGPQLVETSDGIVATGSFFDAEFSNNSTYIGGSFVNATVNGTNFKGSVIVDSTVQEGTFFGSIFKESLILGGFYDDCIFIDCIVLGGAFDQSLFLRSVLFGGEFTQDFFYNETVDGGTFVEATFLRDKVLETNPNAINEGNGSGADFANLQNKTRENNETSEEFLEPPPMILENVTMDENLGLIFREANDTALPNKTQILARSGIAEDLPSVDNLTSGKADPRPDGNSLIGIDYRDEVYAGIDETSRDKSPIDLDKTTLDIISLGIENGTGMPIDSDDFANESSTRLIGSSKKEMGRDVGVNLQEAFSLGASPANLSSIDNSPFFTLSGTLRRAGIGLDGERVTLNQTQQFPNTSAVVTNSIILFVDFDASALFNETDFVFQRFNLVNANVTSKQAFNLSSLSDLWNCNDDVDDTSLFQESDLRMSPSVQPSDAPTQRATESDFPSNSPSDNPSMSLMPTLSENPSLTPSGSSGPSLSNEPTEAPSISTSPSIAPTTTTPTQSPGPSASPPSTSPSIAPDPDPYRLCETEYDSRFDLCGRVFNYTGLFELFGERVDFVQLFGRTGALNFTAPPSLNPIAVRAKLFIYPDEKYTLTVSDSGKDGIFGTYQIQTTVDGQLLLEQKGNTFNTNRVDSFSIPTSSPSDDPNPDRHTSGPPRSDVRH